MKYKCINGWTKEKMKAQIKLKNNGMRAVDPWGIICLYRTPDGNACAIGCFIPDNNQAIRYNCPIDTIHHQVKEYMPIELTGLIELQFLHDRNEKDNLHDVLFYWIDENVED